MVFTILGPDERAEVIAKTRAASLKWLQVDGDSVNVDIGWMTVKTTKESINVVLVSFIVLTEDR